MPQLTVIESPWHAYERLSVDLREDTVRCTCEDGEPYVPLCVRCECCFSLLDALEHFVQGGTL